MADMPQAATKTDTAKATLAESLVAENFAVIDGELAIGGVRASELASAYGSPLFAYDAGLMRANYRRLSAAVEGFADVYYSIKANPNPAIARLFVSEGAGLEIASGAEFLKARAAGCAPERMLFAGPGKGEDELALTLEAGLGEIHLESFEEIETVGAIAQRLQRCVRVAIRINPVAAVQGGAMRMGGKPAAFGFDEEIIDDVLAAISAHAYLDVTGVHLFAGTQILKADVLHAQWGHAIALAKDVAARIGRPLKTIDLGGGLGVPYHGGDQALDLDAVSAGIPALRAALDADALVRDAHVILEPGRYLTANAGVYLMSVRAVKESRGSRFLICDGGMHHHLAASGNLGQVVKRDYPLVAASRMNAGDATQAFVVGPLCTPLDTLGRQTPMPGPMAAGDLVAVLQSGAYGLSASPTGFLSHPMPAEVLVENAAHTAIRVAGTFDKPADALAT